MVIIILLLVITTYLECSRTFENILEHSRIFHDYLKYVERQAQHRPHRLSKPRPSTETEYEGRPVRCRNLEAGRQDILQGIYFGI